MAAGSREALCELCELRRAVTRRGASDKPVVRDETGPTYEHEAVVTRHDFTTLGKARLVCSSTRYGRFDDSRQMAERIAK